MEKKFIKKILDKKINIEREISKLKKNTSLKIFNKYVSFSESYNDKIGEIPFNDKSFFYSYQRHDLTLICKNWLKFLYNIDNTDNSQGVFFANCMASISTLLLAFQKLNYKKILFSNLPYFESYDFAKELFSKENIQEYKKYKNTNIDILWICTASPKFLSIDYKKIKTKIIVLDTSCIDCSSIYIKEIVNFCKTNDITLFLVRSHMKLDCFGLEINRLGSLTCINDKENILEICTKLEIVLGNNTNISNIYPWLGEQEFFDITTKKITKTQKINDTTSRVLKKLLDKNKYEINKFDNKIYFTIKLKNKVDNLDKLNRDTTIYCQKHNLPIVTAASFYLEKVGFDNFTRTLDNNSQFLRLSPSSYISKKDTIETAKKIAEYLNNI